jgi:hypothetical protein
MGDVYDSENSRMQLIDSLKTVMDVYREATNHCETCEGFATLCNRASMRLFKERLLPDFEGWARGLEPSPVFQVEDELEDLLATARAAQELLKKQISSGAPWESNVSRLSEPAGIAMAAYAYDPGVKTEESARAKAVVRYGPSNGKLRHRHLLDLSRLLLVFSNCETLSTGLDHILGAFEVVAVNNFFNTPGRLGMRCVEVLVIVHVPQGGEQIPHVCELRLEEITYNQKHQEAVPLLDKVYEQYRDQTVKYDLNWPMTECVIKTVLSSVPMSADLRRFRCHLTKRYGSTTSGWRKEVGDTVDFIKFKRACHQLNWGHKATEFYQELDASLGGCVNLFHLDPETVVILIRLRWHMLAFAEPSALRKGTTNKFSMEPSALFTKLTSHIESAQNARIERQGQLSSFEFKLLSKPLGLSANELERVFVYLDSGLAGSDKRNQSVSLSDIAWIMKLPRVVDEHAVALNADPASLVQSQIAMEPSHDEGIEPGDAALTEMSSAPRFGAAEENSASGYESQSGAVTPVKIRAGPWKQKKRSPPRSPRSLSPRPLSPPRSMWTRPESNAEVCMCGNVFYADAAFCQKCGAKRLDPETEPPPNEKCQCGAAFATDAIFCNTCGSKRSRPQEEAGSKRHAPSEDSVACACGRALPRDASFCPNCGQKYVGSSQDSEPILKKERDAFDGDSVQTNEPRQKSERRIDASKVFNEQKNEPFQPDERVSVTNEPAQRQKWGMRFSTDSGDTTGKVASASKFANRNGGEPPVDVVKNSDAELSHDTAAGPQAFRKSEQRRGSDTKGVTAAEKASEKGLRLSSNAQEERTVTLEVEEPEEEKESF